MSHELKIRLPPSRIAQLSGLKSGDPASVEKPKDDTVAVDRIDRMLQDLYAPSLPRNAGTRGF